MILATLLYLASGQVDFVSLPRVRESGAARGRGRAGNSYAFFEAFPASGAGTFGVCSTTPPTGAKGEVLTMSRASVAECPSNDGQTFTQMASGVARVSSGAVDSTWLGIWQEEGATNLLLWSRALSDTSWVKTSMTCTRTATGMRNDVNGATTCTATGANGTVTQSVVLASSAVAGSFRIKRLTGTGGVLVTLDGVTYTDVSTVGQLSSTKWKWVVPSEMPGCASMYSGTTWGSTCIPITAMGGTLANPVIGIKLATSGDAVDIDFAQLELAPTFSFYKATTPIETTTASAPRATEIPDFALAVPLPTSFCQSAFTVAVPSELKAMVGSIGVLLPGNATADDKLGSYYWTTWTVQGSALAPTQFFSAALTSSATNNAYFASFASGTERGCLNGDCESQAATFTGLTTARIRVGMMDATAGRNGHHVFGVTKGLQVDPSATKCRTALPSTNRIAAMGDSLTGGNGLVIGNSWPEQLATLTGRQVGNFGVGGGTSAFVSSSEWPRINGKGFGTAVILIGVNDLIAGWTDAFSWGYLSPVLDAVRARGMKLIIMTVAPWSNYASWTAGKQTTTLALNTRILDYCTTYGLTCVDLYNSALRSGTALNATYDAGDGLHLNAAGEAVIAALVQAANP